VVIKYKEYWDVGVVSAEALLLLLLLLFVDETALVSVFYWRIL
jgi:hypothetical protein